MAAALYWRVIVKQASGSYASCAELGMLAATVPQTSGGTALASGQYSATYAAAKAFDSDNATYWRSNSSSSADHWVGYQFAAPVDIDTITFRIRADTTAEQPKQLIIETSDDGVAWTVRASHVSTGWAAGEERSFAAQQDSTVMPRRTSTTGVYGVLADGPPRVSTAGVYVVHGPNKRDVSTLGVYVVSPDTPAEVAPTVSIDQGESASIAAADTLQLTAAATGTPEPTLTWASSNPTVISVDPGSGLATWLQQGTAEVTVTASNGVEPDAVDTIELTALAPPITPPDTPVVTPTVDGSGVVLEGSVFSHPEVGVEHEASRWIIRQGGVIVRDSGWLTSELTERTETALAPGSYTATVEYRATNTTSAISEPAAFEIVAPLGPSPGRTTQVTGEAAIAGNLGALVTGTQVDAGIERTDPPTLITQATGEQTIEHATPPAKVTQVLAEVIARPVPKPVPVGAKLEMLEVWTDVKAAAGQRLAFTRDAVAVTDRRALTGEERLAIAMPLGSAFWGYVLERRVIRVVHTDCTWEEWRIVRVEASRSERNALLGTIDCESIRYDLNNGVIKRAQANGWVEHQFDLYSLSPELHVGEVLQDAPPYFGAGLVHPTRVTDLHYEGTPLGVLLDLAGITETELDVARATDDTYLVQLLRERGASVYPVMLRYQRNSHSMKRSGDSSRQVTRVFPFGAEVDGWRLTIAEARWEVAAVDVARAAVQVAGGLLAFDDQLNGMYLQLPLGAGYREITDCLYATQEVILASLVIDEVAVGDIVRFFADATGTHLTYLDAPEGIATYGGPQGRPISAPAEFSDIPPIDNLVGNAYLDEWAVPEGGTELLPVLWDAVGAPTVAQNVERLYRRYGEASAHVVAAQDEGLESAWWPVVPDERRPYGTAQIAVFVVSGKVRLEWDVADADGIFVTLPDTGDVAHTAGLLNQWTDADKTLAIGGVDLLNDYDAAAFRVRVVAHDGPAEFYLDAAQVTQTASGHEIYYNGLASNDLWRASNRFLREWWRPLFSYDCDALDLHRLYPEQYRHDRLQLGTPVSVWDDELGIDVETRIVELTTDLIREGRTEVVLGALKPDLTQVVVARPTVRQRTGLRTPVPAIGDDALWAIASEHTANAYYNADRVRLVWGHDDIVEDNAGFTLDIEVLTFVGGVLQSTVVAAAGLDPKLEVSGLNAQPNRGSYDLEYFRAPDGAPLSTAATMTYVYVLKQGGDERLRITAGLNLGRFYLAEALENVRAEATLYSELLKVALHWNFTRPLETAVGWTVSITRHAEQNGMPVADVVLQTDQPVWQPGTTPLSSLAELEYYRCFDPGAVGCADTHLSYTVTLREAGSDVASYTTPWVGPYRIELPETV